MGLREINAARTKRMIADAAMELFRVSGYDGTTMEDIAAHAGIGTSTLYRYFPTKDSVILGLLGDPGLIAERLRERPADEPAEVALGHALIAFLSFAVENSEDSGSVRDILENNPRATAKLMEWFGGMHSQLEVALTERLEGPASDLQAGAMAWTAIFVLQRASEGAQNDGRQGDAVAIARQVMKDLATRPFATPRL